MLRSLRILVAVLSAVEGLAATCGCASNAPPPAIAHQLDLHITPLLVQQRDAYEETASGIFISLADFEDPGQLDAFAIEPASPEASRSITAANTRTGVGALDVSLPPGTELVFAPGQLRNFRHYNLLSLALCSTALRDDLRVSVVSGAARWTSHDILLRPGWNTVLIDIRDLERVDGFDLSRVDTVRLGFADRSSTVRFALDDLMLLDNRRRIAGAPPGISLYKEGLDYTLALPGRERPLLLLGCDDGLWRLGDDQPTVQLAAPDVPLAETVEDLAVMGHRKVGQVEILEANPCRLRIANTWYFPMRAGEWASLAVRQIRWEYTFYPDGRWVTAMQLNNAGGDEIGSVRIIWPRPAAIAGQGVAEVVHVRRLAGSAGRWAAMEAPPDIAAAAWDEYLHPAKVACLLATESVPADGDVDRDGYDESQGCYFIRALGAHCRFSIERPAGAAPPVVRLAGNWRGLPAVNTQGLPLRNVVALADGSVLLALPAEGRSSVTAEVIGARSPGG